MSSLIGVTICRAYPTLSLISFSLSLIPTTLHSQRHTLQLGPESLSTELLSPILTVRCDARDVRELSLLLGSACPRSLCSQVSSREGYPQCSFRCLPDEVHSGYPEWTVSRAHSRWCRSPYNSWRRAKRSANS